MDPYTRCNLVAGLKQCEGMRAGTKSEEEVAGRCDLVLERGLLPSIAAFSSDGWWVGAGARGKCHSCQRESPTLVKWVLPSDSLVSEVWVQRWATAEGCGGGLVARVGLGVWRAG